MKPRPDKTYYHDAFASHITYEQHKEIEICSQFNPGSIPDFQQQRFTSCYHTRTNNLKDTYSTRETVDSKPGPQQMIYDNQYI